MKLLHYATIPGFIIPVLILSIFCSVTCNILVNYAAGKMSVGRLAAFSNLQTMWSMFAGVLFLREPFGLSSFIGSVLIIYGIWHVTKKKHTLIFSYLYAPAFLCYTQFKKFTVKGVYTK